MKGEVRGTILVLSALLGILSPALAQQLPNKPLRLIVPLAAGGSVDVITRPLAEDVSKLLSRPIVVENMPGASTNIGAGFVARSQPDGSTLLVTAAAITIQPGINPKMPYDPQKDLAGVSLISN